MTEYTCPVCGKRVCDSEKRLSLAIASRHGVKKADIVIKCQGCKSILSIKVVLG